MNVVENRCLLPRGSWRNVEDNSLKERNRVQQSSKLWIKAEERKALLCSLFTVSTLQSE